MLTYLADWESICLTEYCEKGSEIFVVGVNFGFALQREQLIGAFQDVDRAVENA